jgi:hypothetical protein
MDPQTAGEIGSDEVFIQASLRIIDEAQRNGVILRILGALAVKLHSKEFEELYGKLGRLGDTAKQFTDLDIVGYSKQMGKVSDLLEKKLHYKFDQYFMLRMAGQKRHKYLHPAGDYVIDVFYDHLHFSHNVDFGEKPGQGRLELDYPTITLTDLILEKTQIHEIAEKDVKDIIVLVRAHEIGETDAKETINGKYIAKVLADDWGFYYDATENLKKVLALSEKYCYENKMSSDDLVIVKNQIAKLLNYIENEPKTNRWIDRAKIGTRKPWYDLVEEYRIS